MSQIGYMFVGAGLGAYGSAMFHLMTHAFFKALLFLAAGVVIHHLAGEQDIRKMGGLRASMPKTYIAFLIGSLALVGIPPLSGFFSKDAILASALASGGYGQFLFVVGPGRRAADRALHLPPLLPRLPRRAVAARPASTTDGHGHGEGPWTMIVPVGDPRRARPWSAAGSRSRASGITFGEWLDPIAIGREQLALVEPTTTQDYVTSALAVGLGLDRDRHRLDASTAPASGPCPRIAAVQRRARAQVLVRRALRR